MKLALCVLLLAGSVMCQTSLEFGPTIQLGDLEPADQIALWRSSYELAVHEGMYEMDMRWVLECAHSDCFKRSDKPRILTYGGMTMSGEYLRRAYETKAELDRLRSVQKKQVRKLCTKYGHTDNCMVVMSTSEDKPK